MATRELLSAYKVLLKEMGKYCTKNFQSFWRPELRSLFLDAVQNNPKETSKLASVTSDLATVLKYNRQQTELFEKYNIGGFVDEREKIRKTAARVGLKVPTFADEKAKLMEESLKKQATNM